MTDLLIHSMAEFRDIIIPALDRAECRIVAEIGAEFGGMSFVLHDYVVERGGELLSIDPAPKQAFIDWIASAEHVSHVAKPSLEAFDDLPPVDAWVIDGDHNWYTVYHELKAVAAACAANDKPILAFFHDIHWPCGRRDSYYAPDRIPAEFRQPYSFDGGAKPGFVGLTQNRGFRGLGQFAWATHEGGPRNGVLTAIEDFMAEQLDAGYEYAFAEVPGVFGLGVLFALDAPWSAEMAEAILPFHQNTLLTSLEANRLVNYLQVIEMQDEQAALRQAPTVDKAA